MKRAAIAATATATAICGLLPGCETSTNNGSVRVDTLSGGRVVVYQIRVFSPEGQCLRTFGREGEGPGEFAMLAGIAWQPPGFLWAMDALRKHLVFA